MPHLASSAKRLRQAKKITARRQSLRNKIDFEERQFKKNISAKNKEQVISTSRSLSKSYDKAAAKGMFHKNTAARKKSRMMKKINSL